MSEENKTRRELPLKDFEADFEKYFQYEKSPLWKKFEDYQKNLLCIQDVADRLLGHMKGHGVSFKPEITDAFCCYCAVANLHSTLSYYSCVC